MELRGLLWRLANATLDREARPNPICKDELLQSYCDKVKEMKSIRLQLRTKTSVQGVKDVRLLM